MKGNEMRALMKTLDALQKEPTLGPDTTIRQLLILLHVAAAGSAGTDVSTLVMRTKFSQSSVSRAVEKLGVKDRAGLVRADLDPNNHKFRLISLTPKGGQLLESAL